MFVRNAIMVCAALCVFPVFAGDVSLHKINAASGDTSLFASGDMPHAPAYIVEDSEIYVVDACGSVYGLEEDRYGEMSLTGPIAKEGALADMQEISSWGRGAYGIDRQGKLFKLKFNENERSRYGDDYDYWFAVEDGEFPEAGRMLISDSSMSPMLVTTGGDLLYLKLAGEYVDLVRKVKGGEFSELSSGVVSRIPTSTNNVVPALVSVNNNGDWFLNLVNKDSDDKVSVTQQALPGKLPEVRRLLGVRNDRKNAWLLMVDTDGGIHSVAMATGEATRLAGDLKVVGNAIYRNKNDELFAAVSSATFAACPEKQVVVAEAPAEPAAMDDRGIFALMDRLDAAYEPNKPFYDEIRNEADNPPTHLKSVEDHAAYYGPLLDKVRKFQATQQPMIDSGLRSLENDFQDHGGPENFLHELTDGEIRDVTWNVRNLRALHKDYLGDVTTIAGRFLSNAEINNMVAGEKGPSDTEQKIQLYRDAAQYAEWALKFDKSLTEADQYIQNAEQYVQEARAAEQEALANNTWPGQYQYFDGPGDVDDLAEEAMDFILEELEESGDDTEILQVAVRANWYSYQVNILGEPLNYCLPLYIAYGDRNRPEVAHVNEGEVCTRYPKMDTPFAVLKWAYADSLIQRSRVE